MRSASPGRPANKGPTTRPPAKALQLGLRKRFTVDNDAVKGVERPGKGVHRVHGASDGRGAQARADQETDLRTNINKVTVPKQGSLDTLPVRADSAMPRQPNPSTTGVPKRAR